MYNTFYSNTNYILAPGIVFPITEVIGIIVYPQSTIDHTLYLESIKVQKAVKMADYKVCLQFRTSDNVVLQCVLNNYDMRRIKEDYRLDFTDISTNSYAGCMVVTHSFMMWAFSIPSVSNINEQALVINPSNVKPLMPSYSNYVVINNTPVSKIILNNAIIDNRNIVKIANAKDNNTSDEIYMTKLKLTNGEDTVTLQGKSVGFAIQYPESGYCRVSIETTNGLISFKDDSVQIWD